MLPRNHHTMRGVALAAAAAFAGSLAFAQAEQEQTQRKMKQRRAAATTAAEQNQLDIDKAAKHMNKADIGLADIITTAEKKVSGTALAARVATPLKKMHFEVLCVTEDGKLKRVTVDGRKNKAVKTVAVTETARTARDTDWVVGVIQYTVFRPVQHSTLVDTSVINEAGQELGELEQFAIDPHSGRVVYGAVAFDKAWAMDEKYFAVPVPALHLYGADYLGLDVTRNEMANAEGFNEEQWPNRPNWRWAADLHAHTSPAFELVADERENRLKRRGSRGAADLVRKSEAIIGMTVTNEAGTELGTIEDLYIDPDRAHVAYVVVAHGGTLGFDEMLTAVPWAAFDWYAGNGPVLDITEARLEQAPRCTEANVLTRTDPDWVANVYDFFNLKPYWVTERSTDKEPREM